MPADQHLVEQVRDELAHIEDVVEKNMMGGRCFMVGGHMAFAVHDDTSWSGSNAMSTTTCSKNQTSVPWR